jgi:hypothetical protein
MDKQPVLISIDAQLWIELFTMQYVTEQQPLYPAAHERRRGSTTEFTRALTLSAAGKDGGHNPAIIAA